MTSTGTLVTAILAITAWVPPGEKSVDHTQPYHEAQPVIRRFVRRAEDNDRRVRWESFAAELEDLWRDYREAGSTTAAWQRYKDAAAEARRFYVEDDIYLQPFTP